MPLPIEQCQYRRARVETVALASDHWQYVRLTGSIDVSIPPIEYTIKPGDLLEEWVIGPASQDTEPHIGDRPQWFRLNELGQPFPLPDLVPPTR